MERRLDFRFDQPLCFVYAPKRDEVVPTVFFTNEFPPSDEFDPTTSPGLAYEDLAALIGDGWRVVDDNN